MPSALTGIAVQIAAGIVAGSAVALAVKEYSFGIVKSTVTGGGHSTNGNGCGRSGHG